MVRVASEHGRLAIRCPVPIRGEYPSKTAWHMGNLQAVILLTVLPALRHASSDGLPTQYHGSTLTLD